MTVNYTAKQSKTKTATKTCSMGNTELQTKEYENVHDLTGMVYNPCSYGHREGLQPNTPITLMNHKLPDHKR